MEQTNDMKLEESRGSHRKHIFFIIAMLLWTMLIFSFSLQPGAVSSNMSHGFGRWILETFLPGVLVKLDKLRPEQLEMLHFLLRKCAHFTEYFLLGIWSELALGIKKQVSRWCPAMLYCAVVAMVDETIQLFVGGRSGRVTDVLLDSTGAFTGIMICLFLKMWITKNKNAAVSKSL